MLFVVQLGSKSNKWLSQNEIKVILTKIIIVAGVELSRDSNKDSQSKHEPETMRFHLISVNSIANELGENSYKSLLDILPENQKKIEVFDIFQSSKDIPEIIEQAIKPKTIYRKPNVAWM